MTAPDPRDPRFRPFRTAAWAVYLTVAVGFSALIVYSVFKSVVSMTPDRPAAAGEALPVADCVRSLRGLADELDAQRHAFSRADARQADQRFLEFRVGWLTRKRALEVQCATAAPGRAKLAGAFDELERLMDLTTTSSVQFSGAIAPTLESFRERLGEAAP